MNVKHTLILTSIVICITRLFIKPRLINIPTFELSYEAIAHIFVGILFGMWLSGKYLKKECYGQWQYYKYCWYLAWLISFFELWMFILQKCLMK